MSEILIKYSSDYTIGTICSFWNNLDWIKLHKSKGNLSYETKFKSFWSEQGLYFLVNAEDKQISCSGKLRNFDDIYKEDAVEIFLQPNENIPIYLEHELSPLNKELTLIVPQNNGVFMGWQPWHYEGSRMISHTVKHYATYWQAEIFIPFCLMTGFPNTPPQNGTTWKLNVCRLDYDDSQGYTLWSINKMTSDTFHNLNDFALIKFIN